MGTSERRKEIIKILCRRQHETMGNLASELGVSIRTIQRDVETLSISEPIYTQAGKHGGGVYIVEGYSYDRMYMSDIELNVLKKLYITSTNDSSVLSDNEKKMLGEIIFKYSKPKTNR